MLLIGGRGEWRGWNSYDDGDGVTAATHPRCLHRLRILPFFPHVFPGPRQTHPRRCSPSCFHPPLCSVQSLPQYAVPPGELSIYDPYSPSTPWSIWLVSGASGSFLEHLARFWSISLVSWGISLVSWGSSLISPSNLPNCLLQSPK